MTDEQARPDQYVSFLLAGEEYAVSILRAREIVAYDTITRVPRMAASVRGVLNLRGQVIPVIDLAAKLGLSATEVTRWTCVLVVDVDLDGEPLQLGILVDSVSDVLDLSPGDVEPPPQFGARIRLSYLTGIGKVGEKLVLLLDIDRILAAEDLLAAPSPEAEAPAPSPERVAGPSRS